MNVSRRKVRIILVQTLTVIGVGFIFREYLLNDLQNKAERLSDEFGESTSTATLSTLTRWECNCFVWLSAIVLTAMLLMTPMEWPPINADEYPRLLFIGSVMFAATCIIPNPPFYIIETFRLLFCYQLLITLKLSIESDPYSNTVYVKAILFVILTCLFIVMHKIAIAPIVFKILEWNGVPIFQDVQLSM